MQPDYIPKKARKPGKTVGAVQKSRYSPGFNPKKSRGAVEAKRQQYAASLKGPKQPVGAFGFKGPISYNQSAQALNTKGSMGQLISGKGLKGVLGYKKGGKVKKTGPAIVHKGERVLNTKQTKKYDRRKLGKAANKAFGA